MNEIIVIGPQDYRAKLKEHTAQAVALAQAKLQYANELVVGDDIALEGAMKDFVAWRQEAKDLEEDRKTMTVPINAVLDEINAAFKEPAEIIKEARATVERKGKAYEAVKEAARLKADQEARERARKEEERIRKEKEAQERAWREKEEAARKEAEALAQKAAKERNEAKRAELEAQAEKSRQEAAKAQEKADERAQQAAEVYIPAETTEKTVVKVAGAKTITRYYAKVVDSTKVPVEWNGKVLRPVSDSAIGEVAKMLKLAKGAKSPIEGVTFWQEEKMS